MADNSLNDELASVRDIQFSDEPGFDTVAEAWTLLGCCYPQQHFATEHYFNIILIIWLYFLITADVQKPSTTAATLSYNVQRLQNNFQLLITRKMCWPSAGILCGHPPRAAQP